MENNCQFSESNTSSVNILYLENKIVLSFSETGIGIHENEIEDVFNSFFRGKNKHYHDGNGIGLAFVQKVATMHKATIDVHSVVGEGTTLILTFK